MFFLPFFPFFSLAFFICLHHTPQFWELLLYIFFYLFSAHFRMFHCGAALAVLSNLCAIYLHLINTRLTFVWLSLLSAEIKTRGPLCTKNMKQMGEHRTYKHSNIYESTIKYEQLLKTWLLRTILTWQSFIKLSKSMHNVFELSLFKAYFWAFLCVN